MYGYMSNGDMVKLILEKRDVIVIPDRQLKDLDEYLINVKICLDNSGINTSIFNIPRVIKNKVKKTYTIFLITRRNKKQGDKEEFMRALQRMKSIEPSSYKLDTMNHKTNGGYLV